MRNCCERHWVDLNHLLASSRGSEFAAVSLPAIPQTTWEDLECTVILHSEHARRLDFPAPLHQTILSTDAPPRRMPSEARSSCLTEMIYSLCQSAIVAIHASESHFGRMRISANVTATLSKMIS